MSDDALDTMQELLMSTATPENVRLKAATEILDRIGVRGGFEVQVEGEVTVNPADQVRDRLKKLANTAPQSEPDLIELEPVDSDAILDAEIVDDDDEHRT